MNVEWSPESIAKITMIIMAVPVILSLLSLVISLLISKYRKNTGIDPDSVRGQKLDSISGNIFYVMFLSVGFMQFTFVVLMITALWAAFGWLAGLVN